MKPARASSEDLKALLARWVAHKQNGNLAFSAPRSFAATRATRRLVGSSVAMWLNPLARCCSRVRGRALAGHRKKCREAVANHRLAAGRSSASARDQRPSR